MDLTDKKAELGGDDLLQSLVEAGTYDGKFYGVPYYAGARVMLYRKDLFEASGHRDPDDDRRDVRCRREAEGGQRATPRTSPACTCPARTGSRRCPSSGSTVATSPSQEGDAWTGMLSSAGVDRRPDRSSSSSSQETSGAPKDGDDSKDYIAFCNGEVGMMPAPGWKPGQIVNPDDGCPDMEANIGAFAMPGLDRRHDVAGVPRWLEPGDLGEQRRTPTWPTTCCRSSPRRATSSSSPTRARSRR